MLRINLSRIHDVLRRDGKRIIVPNRRHSRDMSQAQYIGVKQFTSKSNARSRAAARAKNKTAGASRKRNRV